MKRLFSKLTILALALTAWPALADSQFYSAADCVAENSSTVTHASSSSAFSGGAFCPTMNLPRSGGVQMGWVRISLNDYQSTSPISCRFSAVNWTGSYYWGSVRYTCSVWGGCVDPTTSFTGLSDLDLPLDGGTSNAVYPRNQGILCNGSNPGGIWPRVQAYSTNYTSF